MFVRWRWQEACPPWCRGGVAAVGNFDGVHLGHSALIRQLRSVADQLQAPAVVVTFDPHPLAVLDPQRFEPLLSTPERRAELLHAAGADCVVILQTEPSLLALPAEAFFRDVLCHRLAIRGVVEGPNFRFGKDRGGDTALLQKLCQECGLVCVIVEPEQRHGQMISSSKVRQALQRGEVHEARQWLGRPYRLEGTVERGMQRGRTLGFPTANLSGIGTLIPRRGVYAVQAMILDAEDTTPRTYAAAVNIGPNPTFQENVDKVEAHLLDFSGELLGRRLAIDFVQRVRDVQRFNSAEALKSQIQADLVAVRAALSEAGAKPQN